MSKAYEDMTDEELDMELAREELNQMTDEDLDAALDEEERLINDRPFYDVSKKGLLKGAIETLPIAGGLAGTIGGLPGIAAGAAAGKALENIAERYFLDEEKTVPEIYAGPVGEAIGAVTGEAVAPLVGKGLSKITSGLGTAIRKTTSSLATIPEQTIKTYMNRPSAVKEIGQLSEETAIQDAADALRSKAAQSIDAFTRKQNAKITSAIDNKGNEMVDVAPLFKIFNEGKKKIDPIVQRDQLRSIDEQIQLLSRLANDDMTAPAWRVEAFRKRLNDLTTYTQDGQILQRKGDYSNEVFKKAAARARLNIGKVVPEILGANKELSKLRKMDKLINKNLISPEKPAASVLAVGSGQNQQAIKQMRKLEDITGFNYVDRAQDIASAQYFNNPPLMPSLQTGRGAIPMATGTLHALSQFGLGNVGPAMAGIGLAAFGSPMAIKAGMDIGLGAGRVTQKISPLGGAEMAEQLMGRALQMGVSPFVIDGMIKNSEEISATVKAKLRNKNAKAVK